MNSLMYFIIAALLLVGLLFIGGYIGVEQVDRQYTGDAMMSKMIDGSPMGSQGYSDAPGCSKCKWY